MCSSAADTSFLSVSCASYMPEKSADEQVEKYTQTFFVFCTCNKGMLIPAITLRLEYRVKVSVSQRNTLRDVSIDECT